MYLCTNLDNHPLGLFTSLEAAQNSWILTLGTIGEPVFLDNESNEPYLKEVKVGNKKGTIGYITKMYVYESATHL